MKKHLFIISVVALMVYTSIAAATAFDRSLDIVGWRVGENQSHVTAELASEVNSAVYPLQNNRQNASMDWKTVLIHESFDNVPDGSTEVIEHLGDRQVTCIANRDGEPGRYMANEYTPNSGTWEGHDVFAGKNGTIILQCYNPQVGAFLNTPTGDYSGDIIVTVRCRWAKTFIGYPNDIGYATTNGSALSLEVRMNGYDSFDWAKTDIGSRAVMETGVMYEQDGWQEVSFKFHNESANAKGYLSFFTTDAIEIDWIKVEDENTYLACTENIETADFTGDGFTVNWDKVRRAYSYFIDLYKMEYTAERGLDDIYNFESNELPVWLSCQNFQLVENEGAEGSKCLIMPDDETSLETVNQGANLEKFSAKVKFRLNDPESLISLCFDVYGEEGWKRYTSIDCDGWWTEPDIYYQVDFEGTYFSGKYSAIRMLAEGTNENNQVFIDDVAVYTKRPYRLERVYDEDISLECEPENDDFPYNYYDITKDNRYSFKGLEPETEYWYRIRSQRGAEFAIGDKIHAFGVATPEVLPPTNVTKDSYSANWKDVPKAQKYYVTNYTVNVIEQEDEEYSFISDGFSGCEGSSDLSAMTPIDNTDECYLDQYTDCKGWRGKNNYIGANMIGCSDKTDSYIISPVMMLNPERGNAIVYIEAEGTPEDALLIRTLKGRSSGHTSFDENGLIKGWFEISPIKGEQVRFASYDNLSFALKSCDIVQRVKPGDIVFRFNCMNETEAGIGSCTFNNLQPTPYAYDVMASYVLDGETAYSAPGATEYVGINISGIEVPANDGAFEVARWSIDGFRVDKNYKGIVVVKMSDGRFQKIISK